MTLKTGTNRKNITPSQREKLVDRIDEQKNEIDGVISNLKNIQWKLSNIRKSIEYG
jgi:transcription termination factor NusB